MLTYVKMLKTVMPVSWPRADGVGEVWVGGGGVGGWGRCGWEGRGGREGVSWHYIPNSSALYGFFAE